jgi:hypothetical protein
VGEHKEVRHERLYLKVPGGDKLRARAEGRVKHLLATGWREVERTPTSEYVRVRFERTGHVPANLKLKQGPPPERRPRERDDRGGRGRGGPRGGFGGGGGGPRGGGPGGGGGPRG